MIRVGEIRTGQTEGFAAGARAQMKTPFTYIKHDFIRAKPFTQLVDVLFLEQQALFGQLGGQFVVEEANHGELMSVKTAGVDFAGLHAFQAQAGQTFGAVVVADAERHSIQQVLKKVAGPQDSLFLGERRQSLEPYRIGRGQFVGTAALLHKQGVGGRVEVKPDIAAGQTAQKFDKGPAVDAHLTFFLHVRRIGAGEFDVDVRGHQSQLSFSGQIAFRSFNGLEPNGAQVGRPCFAWNDGRRFLQAVDNLLFLYC